MAWPSAVPGFDRVCFRSGFIIAGHSRSWSCYEEKKRPTPASISMRSRKSRENWNTLDRRQECGGRNALWESWASPSHRLRMQATTTVETIFNLKPDRLAETQGADDSAGGRCDEHGHAAAPSLIIRSGRSFWIGIPVSSETRNIRLAGTCESAHCATAAGLTLRSRARATPLPRSSSSQFLKLLMTEAFKVGLNLSQAYFKRGQMVLCRGVG